MKLLIVRAADNSTWGSCKVISPNLQKSYELLGDDFVNSWFDIPSNFHELELENRSSHIIDLAEKIKKEKPDQVIFVDHLPQPAEILNKLSLVMELSELPPVSIHVYGDFTYFSNHWLKLGPKLLNHPVKLITASLSQKKLLNTFCEEENSTEQFCFPVDSQEYYFDPKARTQLRAELGIDEKDIIILYSGRISLQKNVDCLIKEYLKYVQKTDNKVHLWLVGAVDDMGAPFMGVETKEGYLFSKIQSILGIFDKDITSKIKLWGIQDKKTLRAVKSASDLFISLSLYHDEDFGMSPAEALACGLPTLLTDWGGYSSFASKDWRCQLVPVAINEYGLQIKSSAIEDFISIYKECYVNEHDRNRWASEFLKEFSIEASSLKLQKILKSAFSHFAGFNWKLATYAKEYAKSNTKKTIDAYTGPSSKNFYYQIYQNYISLKEEKDTKSYETIQWIYDFMKNTESELVVEVKTFNSIHNFLTPFSHSYYGPHNPSLLLNGSFSRKPQNKKLCVMRDGLLSLLQFFKTHSPESFGEIAIDKKFWFLVPLNWRSKTFLYEFKTKNIFTKSNLPKKILISGTFNPALADERDYNQDLEVLVKTFGKDHIEKMEIHTFFPEQNGDLPENWQDPEVMKYAQAFFNQIKNDIHISDWQKINSENNLLDCLYFELNQGYIIQDTLIKQFCLSKGAGLSPAHSPVIPGEHYATYQLSQYHSIEIVRPDYSRFPAPMDPFEHKDFNYYKKISDFHQDPESLNYFAPWYVSYIKRFYQQNPPSFS